MIYQYDNYKNYLNDKISSMPSKGRGIKIQLSQYLNCQNTHVSQVLNGNIHFTPEQGALVNAYFEHTKNESRFFLLLLSSERAQGDVLKKFYLEEINEMRIQNADIKKRTKISTSVKEKHREIYYSTWIYSAIHILVTIKEFQEVSQISKRLKMNKKNVQEALDVLVSMGVVEREGQLFRTGQSIIHLDKKSLHTLFHHKNWRLKAIDSLNQFVNSDLHFTSVVSLSENDVHKVREILLKSITQSREIIRPSKEEKLYSICLDFFEV